MFYNSNNKQSNTTHEINDNKVNVVTTFSQSAGPSLLLVTSFLVLIITLIFGIVLVQHFSTIGMIGFWIVIAVMGGIGIMCTSFLLSRGALFWIDAYQKFLEARAQVERNGVLAVTENAIAYNSDRPIAVVGTPHSRTVHQLESGSPDVIDSSATVLGSAPTFYELIPELDRISKEDWNKVAAEKRIMTGFTKDGMRTVQFGDVRSIAIGGKQGFGKTITLAFFILQAVLHGFRIVLLDPHANNNEGLVNKVRGVVQSIIKSADGSELIQTLEMIWNELERRKAPNQVQSDPWLIVADELPAMMRAVKGSEDFGIIDRTITAVADEGRKYGMFFIGASHRWKQATIGKADIRQAFPAQITHRNDASEVALLMACTPSEAISGARLGKGYTYINDSLEAMVLSVIPLVTPEDSDRVGAMREVSPLEISGPSERRRKTLEIVRNECENLYESSPQAALDRFQEMVAINSTKAEIFAEIFGNPRPGANKAYLEACRNYDTMLDMITMSEETTEELTIEL